MSRLPDNHPSASAPAALALAALCALMTQACRPDATALVLTVTFPDGVTIDQVRIEVTQGPNVVASGLAPDPASPSPVESGGTIAVIFPDDVSGGVDVSGIGLFGGLDVIAGGTTAEIVRREWTEADLALNTTATPPLSVVVVGDDVVNPADTVNIATVSSVSVDVELDPLTQAGDSVDVRLIDAAATEVMVSAPAAGGGGLMRFDGIDASALADGPLTLEAEVVRGGLPVGLVAGAGDKDTVPPLLEVDPVVSPTSIPTQTVSGLTEPGLAVVVNDGTMDHPTVATASGSFAVDVPLTMETVTSLDVTATDVALNVTGPVSVDRAGGPLQISHSVLVPDLVVMDVSAGSGTDDPDGGQGAAVADVDGDGDLDLFITGNAILFLNNGSGVFTDSGEVFAGGRSAVFADYDNDGDPDLATSDPVTLFRNDSAGGTVTFTDVTATTWDTLPVSNSEGSAWIDYDADGLVDHVIENGGNTNALFHNGATLPWPDEAATAGVDFSVDNGHWVTVADFDIDADVDLVIADILPSQFLRNLGDGTFVDATMLLGTAFDDTNDEKGGLAFGDFDNDADFDLLVLRGADLSGDNLLFQFDGTVMTDVAAAAGIATDILANDCAWGDLNQDGLLDLVVAATGPNAIFLNLGDTNGDGVPELNDIAPAIGAADPGDARSVMLFDVDNDGDLDLYFLNSLTPNLLYINASNSPRHLTVTVEGGFASGGTANRGGIGAVVELLDETMAPVATREVNGGRGHGAQDSPWLSFGGVLPSVEYTLRVTFPGGATATATVRPADSPVILVSE